MWTGSRSFSFYGLYITAGSACCQDFCNWMFFSIQCPHNSTVIVDHGRQFESNLYVHPIMTTSGYPWTTHYRISPSSLYRQLKAALNPILNLTTGIRTYLKTVLNNIAQQLKWYMEPLYGYLESFPPNTNSYNYNSGRSSNIYHSLENNHETVASTTSVRKLKTCIQRFQSLYISS